MGGKFVAEENSCQEEGAPKCNPHLTQAQLAGTERSEFRLALSQLCAHPLFLQFNQKSTRKKYGNHMVCDWEHVSEGASQARPSLCSTEYQPSRSASPLRLNSEGAGNAHSCQRQRHRQPVLLDSGSKRPACA